MAVRATRTAVGAAAGSPGGRSSVSAAVSSAGIFHPIVGDRVEVLVSDAWLKALVVELNQGSVPSVCTWRVRLEPGSSHIETVDDIRRLRPVAAVSAGASDRTGGSGPADEDDALDAADEDTSATASSSKKRKQSRIATVGAPDDDLHKQKVALSIPIEIKLQLAREHEEVNVRKRVLAIPFVRKSKKTVQQALLGDYLKSDPSVSDATLAERQEVAKAVVAYFNAALPTNLLYAAERPMFSKWTRGNESLPEKSQKTPAEAYGCEHLVRLFLKLPILLTMTRLDQEAMKIVTDTCSGVLQWLATKLSDPDYFASSNDAPA